MDNGLKNCNDHQIISHFIRRSGVCDVSLAHGMMASLLIWKNPNNSCPGEDIFFSQKWQGMIDCIITLLWSCCCSICYMLTVGDVCKIKYVQNKVHILMFYQKSRGPKYESWRGHFFFTKSKICQNVHNFNSFYPIFIIQLLKWSTYM